MLSKLSKQINYPTLFLVLIFSILISLLFLVNKVESKDIYFGSQSNDNIIIVGALCLDDTCHSTWPSGVWSTVATDAYYNVAGGNVGIGTSSPEAKLDVLGAGNFTDIVTANTPQSSQGSALVNVEYLDAVVADLSSGGLTGSGLTNRIAKWNSAESLGSSIIYDDGTNIGIGTTNPSFKLDVAGSAYAYSNVKFATTSGNVGIGTTNPNYKLHVEGSVKISDIVTANTPGTGDSLALATVGFITAYVDFLKYQHTPLPGCGNNITDADGNSYPTVQIGGQCWMAKNMNVGTLIPAKSSPDPNNQIIEKWCYAGNANNCNTYGAYYSWDEAMQGSMTEGAQGICPAGWHIPTDAEFNVLERTTLFMIDSPNPQNPCDLVSTSYDRCSDISGPNGVSIALFAEGTYFGPYRGSGLTGFNGSPSGQYYSDGSFLSPTSSLSLWTSTASLIYSYQRILGNSIGSGRRDFKREDGLSVRCIKD